MNGYETDIWTTWHNLSLNFSSIENDESFFFLLVSLNNVVMRFKERKRNCLVMNLIRFFHQSWFWKTSLNLHARISSFRWRNFVRLSPEKEESTMWRIQSHHHHLSSFTCIERCLNMFIFWISWNSFFQRLVEDEIISFHFFFQTVSFIYFFFLHWFRVSVVKKWWSAF